MPEYLSEQTPQALHPSTQPRASTSHPRRQCQHERGTSSLQGPRLGVTPYAGTPYASTSSSPYSYHSPAYTQSSFPASPGPMSPPPLNHSRSLYACAPLPALNCDIHPVLSAHSRHKTTLDVSYDPAYTVSASPVLSPRVLAEPATTALLPHFIITLDPLPWRISVRPSSSKSGAYITVADVLNAIYLDLRRQVRKEELETLPPHVIASARQAFYSRCSRVGAMDPSAADSEARKGLRRIDFLFGNSLFAGLLPTSESPDSWRLTFSSS
ncbi:hypothetical protein MVEN_01274400 [Mycena venus]|uniref:DUF6699 domain-containing protein n=1 Tax=Mycena venus TaxID=2733690 RepID=A0A8H7CWN1_9AGAR|nr:hypothetical protein MVEN_01274400 [Mycena venus]